MVFNSLTFLVFLAVVLAFYYSPLSWKTKKVLVLIASYIFYGAWNPPFIILLWISTAMDWYLARYVSGAKTQFQRRMGLTATLVSNLGLLGFFKYGNFLLENFVAFMAALGIQYRPPEMSIILPIGISFYTFHSMSYTLDVYLGRSKPCRSFLDFALYVAFFPQLVAGPILRATDFLPQCVEPRRTSRDQFGWGFALLVVGLFEKVVLADWALAPVADLVYGSPGQASPWDAWLGTLAFSAQIFFDFAGYSSCALGVALLMGFVFKVNFNFPYAAVGFSDFWRRWHISLSSWLRDYLYVPLGGNRHGEARTYLNLMLTMLLGGLWHGAAWHFVAWGGLHGAYLMGERVLRARWGPVRWVNTLAGQLLLAGLTYGLVCITWVFFRAKDFASGSVLLKAMFTCEWGLEVLRRREAFVVVGITAAMLAGHWLMRENGLGHLWQKVPWWGRSIILAVMLLLVILAPGNDRAFIYFQF